MFGDLTTVSMGYSHGSDVIHKIVDDGTGNKIQDPNFRRTVARNDYRVGITQVLTRNLLASLNFETISEQGLSAEPLPLHALPACSGFTHLRARARDLPAHAYQRCGFDHPEVLPALARRALGPVPLLRRHLGHRRAHGRGGIHAPWKQWVFTGSYRFYTQNQADFFSDLFPAIDAQNFMARDKESSALNTNTIGLGVAYEFPVGWAQWLKRGTANFHLDHLMVDYSQFRDLRPPASGPAPAPGTEPLYSLTANIFQFYVSFWF